MFESITKYRETRQAERALRFAEQQQAAEQQVEQQAVRSAGMFGAVAEVIGTTIRSLFGGRASLRKVIDRVRGWVFICLELRGNALSSLEFQFFEQDPTAPNGRKLLSADHKLVRLFSDPVPDLEWITLNEIIKLLATWRAVVGKAYLWTVLGTDGFPSRMYVIPPGLITPVPDDEPDSRKNRTIKGYNLQTPSGRIKFLSRQEICYFPRLGLGQTLWDSLVEGSGIVEAMMDEITAAEQSAEFVSNSLMNGGMPPMLLERDASAEKMNEQQFEKWTQKWLERYQGTGGKAPLGALPPGFKLREVNLMSNVVAMLATARDMQEAVGNAFGVPPGRMRKNASNYATAQVENYQFRSDTIEPEAYTITAVLTRHFRKFQTLGEKRYIIAHVPFIWEDGKELREQEAHELDRGIISKNEARAKRGLKPVEGGDVYATTMNQNPIALLLQNGASTGAASTDSAASAPPA